MACDAINVRMVSFCMLPDAGLLFRLLCQTVWIQIKARQIVGPDMGHNCLQGLPRDNNRGY